MVNKDFRYYIWYRFCSMNLLALNRHISLSICVIKLLVLSVTFERAVWSRNDNKLRGGELSGPAGCRLHWINIVGLSTFFLHALYHLLFDAWITIIEIFAPFAGHLLTLCGIFHHIKIRYLHATYTTPRVLS